MNKCLLIFALVVITAGLSWGAVSKDVVAEYAFVKKPSNELTTRDKLGYDLPVASPRRGVVIAYGNFLSRGAGWTVVDLDVSTITHAETTYQMLPDGTIETVVVSRKSRPLTPKKTQDIIIQANQVWNPASADSVLNKDIIMDSACDIILFDGEAMEHLTGMGCPAKELVKAIESGNP